MAGPNGLPSKMYSKSKQFWFYGLILTMIAGSVLTQISTMVWASGSHQFCSRLFGACTDCESTPPAAKLRDACCKEDSACGPIAQSQPDSPEEDAPESDRTSSGCSCCIMIRCTTYWELPGSAPRLSLSILAISEPRFADMCNATAWVDSLLRPPCL